MESERVNTEVLSTRIADHISAMLAYWDKDLVCRFANSAYLEWFGKNKEVMVNNITIDELLGRTLFERHLPNIMGALRGEIQTFEGDIQLPNGKTRYSLVNYFPDIDDGEVKGFFVHSADVTSLKVMEKDLKKSNEIINETNKRLLNFSNIVSHNLKAYSNNLSSILELYTSADSETDKNEMLGYLESISRGFSSTIDHLTEIVKSQNQAKLNSESLNLYNYIEDTVNIIQLQIKSGKAVVKNNVDKDFMISMNPAYLESILLNLLTNAIKYSHPDRVPVIVLESFENKTNVGFTIQDNGRGINLEKFGSQIFGMYKTFHGNPDAQGVGLYIVKYQIETMGGTIEVQSTENVGSTFTVSLPKEV